MIKISGRHFFLVFVMVFIIASCRRANQNQAVPTAEPTDRPTATATVVKTSTKQEPTQVPTLEPTAVITETLKVDDGIVSEKCIDGIAELGEAENISGSIVLYVEDGSTHNLTLFETETNKTTEITPHYFENTSHILFLNGVSVSPDGEYLAYQTSYFVGDFGNSEYFGNKIKIINAKNEIISQIDNIYTTQNLAWLNNNVLLMRTGKSRNPLILTEISSGHQKYLYPTLGDYFTDYDYFTWWFFYGTHKNVYNSDLTRVVYPETGPNVIMRDLENDTDLVTIPTKNGFGAAPVWSPDGNYFAIAIADERDRTEEFITIFNREGEIVFQTDASTTEMEEVIYIMAWSPDSKQLGFVYIVEEPGETEESSEYPRYLGLVDVEEEKITLYCSAEVYVDARLYWSPDNRYLLYPSQLTDEDEMKSYVLDIETGQNYLVMVGYAPGGWMK